jgi:hypothetical protein
MPSTSTPASAPSLILESGRRIEEIAPVSSAIGGGLTTHSSLDEPSHGRARALRFPSFLPATPAGRGTMEYYEAPPDRFLRGTRMRCFPGAPPSGFPRHKGGAEAGCRAPAVISPGRVRCPAVQRRDQTESRRSPWRHVRLRGHLLWRRATAHRNTARTIYRRCNVVSWLKNVRADPSAQVLRPAGLFSSLGALSPYKIP